MNNPLTFRPMQPGEEQEVSELIRGVFTDFVAPDFLGEGIKIFMDFIQPAALKERREKGNYIILAYTDAINGIIEIRDKNHVALFFVDRKSHRQGIGKQLMQAALEKVISENPDVKELTVHSSLYAVPVYEKLGFVATSTMQEDSGIKYVPMVRKLEEK